MSRSGHGSGLLSAQRSALVSLLSSASGWTCPAVPGSKRDAKSRTFACNQVCGLEVREGRASGCTYGPPGVVAIHRLYYQSGVAF